MIEPLREIISYNASEKLFEGKNELSEIIFSYLQLYLVSV